MDKLLHQTTHDRDLIRESLAGNDEAFRALITRHKERAFRLAYAFCGNTEDAYDICQEAFIEVHRSLKKFRQQARFTTWLHRIVVNKAIDYKRKHAARARTTIAWDAKDSDTPAPEHAIAAPKSSRPDTQATQNELGAILQEALAQLPEQQQTVFILKNIEGYLIREIADMLHISSGTVKAHLWQATQHMRKLLQPIIST